MRLTTAKVAGHALVAVVSRNPAAVEQGGSRMATGTREGTLPGTAMVSVPGPLFEFADALNDDENLDVVSERLMKAFASGRRGRAPKGYGMHIIADRQLVDELRALATMVTAGGVQPEVAEILSEMDVNLKAGARRFLNRTSNIRYATPAKPQDGAKNGDQEQPGQAKEGLSEELRASLEAQGIDPDDLSADEKAQLAAEGTGLTGDPTEDSTPPDPDAKGDEDTGDENTGDSDDQEGTTEPPEAVELESDKA